MKRAAILSCGSGGMAMAVARANAEEIYVLVEPGFEDICFTPDDFMVFRKRK